MYQQQEVEKKERRKIIAAATVAVALILILIVAIIVVATKKSSRTSIGKEENSSFELKDESSENTEDEAKDQADQKSEEETNENSEAGQTSAIGTISTEKTKAKEDNKSTESTKTEQKTENTTVVVSDSKGDMPNTGPEDFLPIALMAGMLATYLTSAVLAKREAQDSYFKKASKRTRFFGSLCYNWDTPGWWNWQTRMPQEHMPQGVQVQILFRAPQLAQSGYFCYDS